MYADSYGGIAGRISYAGQRPPCRDVYFFIQYLWAMFALYADYTNYDPNFISRAQKITLPRFWLKDPIHNHDNWRHSIETSAKFVSKLKLVTDNLPLHWPKFWLTYSNCLLLCVNLKVEFVIIIASSSVWINGSILLAKIRLSVLNCKWHNSLESC